MSKILGINTRPDNAPQLIINGAMEIADRLPSGTDVPTGTAQYQSVDRMLTNIENTWTSPLISQSSLPGGFTGEAFVNRATRIVGTPTNALSTAIWRHRIESKNIFPFVNEPGSMGFFLHSDNLTEVQVKWRFPTVTDNYSSSTNFVDQTFALTLGSWNFIKLENIIIDPGCDKGLSLIIIGKTPNSVGVNADNFFTQLSFNPGPIVFPFKRFAASIDGEINEAKRFYQKSYASSAVPGSSTTLNRVSVHLIGRQLVGAGGADQFEREMRVSPTMRIFNNAGLSNIVTYIIGDGNADDAASSISSVNTKYFSVIRDVAVNGQEYAGLFHFDADAEI